MQVLGYTVLMLQSTSPDLSIAQIRAFVPALDFARSKLFYAAIGCKVDSLGDNLAVLELENHRFYLQSGHVKDYAENFMLTLVVADARAWHEHIVAMLAANHISNARVAAPKHEPWGALVTYVWDPAGVLLLFTQFDQP